MGEKLWLQVGIHMMRISVVKASQSPPQDRLRSAVARVALRPRAAGVHSFGIEGFTGAGASSRRKTYAVRGRYALA